MPINLPLQLRFFNPPLLTMKPGPSITCTRAIPIISRIFPFKLKYLGFVPHVCVQLGVRRFSTRPFRSRSSSELSRGGGRERREVSASKSLIEDEAELSDWVSDLRTSSFRGGRLTSDEENSGIRGSKGKNGRDTERGKGRGRERERDRDREFFSVKRKRGYGEFGEFNRRRNGRQVEPFSRNSRALLDSGFGEDDVDEEGFNPRRKNNGSGRYSGRRNGRQADSFSWNSGAISESEFGEDDDDDDDEEGFNPKGKNRGSGRLMNGRRGKHGNSMSEKRGRRDIDLDLRRSVKGIRDKKGFVDVDDEEDDADIDDDDDDESKTLRGNLGGLLSEEESDKDDEDDDPFFKRNAFSSLGLDKEMSRKDVTSSSGTSDSYLSGTRFDQCSISPLSLKGIKDAGYEKMTVVQDATLPVILKGKDVLAKAKTGTGKTVAFLVPSIEVVIKTPSAGHDQKRPPIIVLVICPTRELASQAAAEANTLLKYHPSIGVQVVMGGTRLALEQKRMQANSCQILVATPGRLRDHIENTAGFATRLKGVKVLVLDEADHLLDMGFRKDIEKIIDATPKQRQTLLFSATVPEEVRQICHIALKRDHEFINTVQEGAEETHAQVRQMHLVAPLDKHFTLLYVLLKDHIADNLDYKVLVFCTTAMVTRLIADLLGELKLNVREIHSRKPQSYRTRVSDEFRKSKGLILVTSDVSARGVDYPDVTLVIQLGLPADREQYIHRLGRTGRKGKEGQGILLLAPWEEFFVSTIKDLPIAKAPVPSIDPDTKKKVERALSHVEMKNKEAAYQAWLGYYNSNKKVGRDKHKLVELANEFSRSMGLDNPPAIPKLVLGKMGLRNVPGLRAK